MTWFDRPEGFVAKSFDTFIPDDVAAERFSAVVESEGRIYGLGADGWDAASVPVLPSPDEDLIAAAAAWSEQIARDPHGLL